MAWDRDRWTPAASKRNSQLIEFQCSENQDIWVSNDDNVRERGPKQRRLQTLTEGRQRRSRNHTVRQTVPVVRVFIQVKWPPE